MDKSEARWHGQFKIWNAQEGIKDIKKIGDWYSIKSWKEMKAPELSVPNLFWICVTCFY